MRRKLYTIALLLTGFTYSGQVFAQKEIGEIMNGGITDCNILMNAYGGPILKAFGTSLNGGWFQTAKPHGLLGFDLTVSLNPVFIPTADKSFSVTALNMQNLRLKAGQVDNSPTFFGEKSKGPLVELIAKSPATGNDTAFKEFNLPQGVGLSMLPIPTAQFSVGVGFGTEIGIRYIPSIDAGGFKIGMVGFGLKHDFKQWIPGMKALPFDMSVQFGYSKITASVALGLKSDTASDVYDPYAGNPDQFKNQSVEFTGTAWTANLLISKKLLFFTPYLGLGFQTSSVDLAMVGNYPITGPNDKFFDVSDPGFGKSKKVMSYTDPLKISGDLSSMRATVGFRLKLTILTIHADYTLAKYNMASVGIGINVQSLVPPSL